jgi:hypothetical protein
MRAFARRSIAAWAVFAVGCSSSDGPIDATDATTSHDASNDGTSDATDATTDARADAEASSDADTDADADADEADGAGGVDADAGADVDARADSDTATDADVDATPPPLCKTPTSTASGVWTTVPYAQMLGPVGTSRGAQVHDVSVDAADDAVYAIGPLEGTADFGVGGVTAVGKSDAFLAKYDATGTLVRVKTFGAVGATLTPNSVRVVGGGDVVVIGGYYGAPSLGGPTLPDSGSTQGAFIARYTRDGTHAWSVGYVGSTATTSAAIGERVAIMPDGGVVAGFDVFGTVDFGGGFVTSAGENEFVLVSYHVDGTVTWRKHIGGGASNFLNAMVATPSGDVIVGGTFSGTTNLGGADLVSPPGAVSSPYVARYGPTGDHVWSETFGYGDAALLASLDVLPGGDLAIGGVVESTVGWPPCRLVTAGDYDGYIARLDATGALVWARTLGGPEQDALYRVHVDHAGSIVVTGAIKGVASVGGPSFGSSTPGVATLYVATYEADGVFESSQPIEMGGTLFPAGLDVTSTNHPVMGAYFAGTIDFDGRTLVGPTGTFQYAGLVASLAP